jgi:2-haloacid dehalogenase
MFTEGGIMPLLDHRLDVAAPQRWKPHPAAYQYAAEACDVPVERMALVAVHPWDIDGARRAGLQAIYVDRRSTPYPKGFLPPSRVVEDFGALADALQK